MRSRLAPVLGLLILLGATSASAEEKTAGVPDALIRELAGLAGARGQGVGYSFMESRFWRLSRTLLERGTRADFEGFTKHAKPVVRAMGLYCLSLTEGEKAVPILRRFLADEALMDYQPHGCLTFVVPVGGFAWHLIQRPDDLSRWVKRTPSHLDEDARMAMDLEILSGDDRVGLREIVAGRWSWRLKDADASALNLGRLRDAWPGSKPWRILKALGRVPPRARSRAVLDVLLASLADEKLSRRARLAAASGLTRETREEVGAALRKARDALDAGDPARPGSRMLHNWNLRKSEHDRRNPRLSHPRSLLLYVDALKSPSTTQPSPEASKRRARLVDGLLRMSTRMGQFTEPWDTWADLPWALRSAVADIRYEVHFRPSAARALTDPEAARILAAVDRHLKTRE